MSRITKWFDESVNKLCDWLNDQTPRQHPLTVAGDALAGANHRPPLPFDRRIGPNILMMAGSATWGKKELKNGSKGTDVKSLQTMLNDAGVKPKLKVDGKFGPKTEAPVKEFQKKNSLKQDGIVGPKTTAKLSAKLSGGSGGGAAGGGKVVDKGDSKKCSYWALCNVAGVPCTRCKGKNAFDGKKAACPRGTNRGQSWKGCCKDAGGTMRHINFVDCCSTTADYKDCSTGEWCKTYSAGSNWCPSSKGSYYCTLVEHAPKLDASCKP